MPLIITVAAMNSAYPLIIKQAFSWIQDKDGRILILIPLLLLVAAAFKSVSLFGQTFLTNMFALRVVRDVQDALFARIHKLDMSYLNSGAAGILVSPFINDMELLRNAIIRMANNLGKDALTVIGALAAMFWINWQMALAILVLYPLATLPIALLGRRIHALSLASQQQAGRLTALLSESIGGADMVRAYNLQASEMARAHASFGERYKLALALVRYKSLVDPFLEVVAFSGLAAVLAFAGWQSLHGVTAVPDLMGMITAIGVLAPSARALGGLNAIWQEGMAAMQRVYELMDLYVELGDQPDAQELKVKAGEIVFDDVQFSYDGAPQALDGVSFTAKAGQTIALVGPSGAGKTTVFGMILRFFPAHAGEIRIDGVDIAHVQQKGLRDQIAHVGQNPVLFDDTIRTNIAYVRPDATDEEIKQAAQDAALGEFISRLPQGLDTRVGENGKLLSGGQRQRVAIARAILKDAPILLLDEATSALDTQSEAQIQHALDRLASGRTTIVIAHRLATVRDADNILVMDDGRIVERGTHQDLLAAGGLYAQLADGQFG